MKKLEIIMTVIFCFGFLLMLGAVGNVDFTGIMGSDYFVKTAIGALMMVTPIIAGKIIVEGGISNRSRKDIREQNQEISRRK